MNTYNFEEGLWTNVYSNIIRKDGPLNNEPEMLLSAELRNPLVYLMILDRIAFGKRGLPLNKIKVGNSNVIPYINRLEKMDIIKREYPLNEPKRGALYVFKEEFFRFWFKYIRRNYWLIEMEKYKSLLDNIKESINEYLAYTYEKILREFLILSAGQTICGVKIPNFRKFGPFWQNEIEVDALGVFRDGILVGEAKWSEKKLSLHDISEIIEKAKTLAERFGKQKYIVIILSKSGFSRKYEEENLLLLDHTSLENELDKHLHRTL